MTLFEIADTITRPDHTVMIAAMSLETKRSC
jgi:hypothetical protein